MEFSKYLLEQNLNKVTIKTHMRNLERFGELNDRPIIEHIEKCCDTTSKKMSMASTISKYLKFKELPNEHVQAYIMTTLQQFKKEKLQKTAELVLPTLADIKKEMNQLYEKEDWRSYVLLFLMVQYQCRNMDLIAKVVPSKRDTNDEDNWFISTASQVTWIRNKYKTAKIYGTKKHVIKNKKFMHAISQLDCVLCEKDNVDRVVKKATTNLGYITEGTIVKIVLSETKNNNMNGINKVKQNRGTTTDKLTTTYNIT